LATKATSAKPVAATSPSRPIEVLRIRTRRPSPARVEPITLRDSSCPILESTTTDIGGRIERVERFVEETQYWVDDSLSQKKSLIQTQNRLTYPF
jgi:hypothetical protein